MGIWLLGKSGDTFVILGVPFRAMHARPCDHSVPYLRHWADNLDAASMSDRSGEAALRQQHAPTDRNEAGTNVATHSTLFTE